MIFVYTVFNLLSHRYVVKNEIDHFLFAITEYGIHQVNRMSGIVDVFVKNNDRKER